MTSPRSAQGLAAIDGHVAGNFLSQETLKMGTKRTAVIALISATIFVGTGLVAANAQESSLEPLTTTDASIDYSGFLELVTEVEPIREARLIDLDKFNEMKAEAGTIILDTRSAKAFEMGHINGAINLPFSDFTDEKLAKVIPEKTSRILIYCNNNFSDNVNPIMLKRVELALNVPTFVNLWGYGYENIYELGSYTESSDPRVDWVSQFDTLFLNVQEN